MITNITITKLKILKLSAKRMVKMPNNIKYPSDEVNMIVLQENAVQIFTRAYVNSVLIRKHLLLLFTIFFLTQ